MTIEARATGWLSDLFHARWREAMLHALVQHDLLCPVYCLMPDHAHFIWLGGSTGSDQRHAVTEFRRNTNRLLAPLRWQREAYDHVLREVERKQDAFRTVCWYVLENPVRKDLVSNWKDYPYSGALFPGYPDLDPRRADFWEVFWKIYSRRMTAAPETAGKSAP
jgi:putative transposase